MQTKRIIRFDASGLKDSSCLRRFYWQVVCGYRTARWGHDVHYGSSFHKCVETYHRTKDEVKAHQAAIHYFLEKKADFYVKKEADYLHEGHLALACMKFYKEHKEDSIFRDVKLVHVDGVPLVEQKFSIPLMETENCIYLLQGTIDSIYQMGKLVPVGDWKTTRARDREAFKLAFYLSPQMRTYCWALRWLARASEIPLAAEILAAPKHSAFVYAAFLSKDKTVEFERSNVIYFSDRDLDVFESGVKSKLYELDYYILKGEVPPPEGVVNGACNAGFGECKYAGPCRAEINSEVPEKMLELTLERNFIKQEYKPLEFGGGVNNK